jgi:predicted  nucleic acid-binding Zn-ribbon protein
LILSVGALVLQFVLPSEAGADDPNLDAIRADITQLKQTGASQSLKLAYMDAESAFLVFVAAVGDLRQQITDKNGEINDLKNEYAQGIIARDDYERRVYQLNAELLDARVTTAAGTLDRMIASSQFSDLRSNLITLREQAQPLVDEVNNLVSTIRVGAIDATEFQNRYTALSAMFEQFDGYVTSAATTKLVQATEKVANRYGYDIVIRKKDVIMYRNAATIDDITDLVKAEIQGYL